MFLLHPPYFAQISFVFTLVQLYGICLLCKKQTMDNIRAVTVIIPNPDSLIGKSGPDSDLKYAGFITVTIDFN